MALAAILLARFDLTLLDEPTNDLDFDGLSRLEDIVARRTGGMVIVSHDRAFLERTVTDVLELDEHSRTGTTYGGGWDAYQRERAADQSHAADDYAVYESQRADLRRRAQRERQWATTGVAREKKHPRDNDTSQRKFRMERTETLAGRARRTERALDALQAVEKPWEGWDLRFNISETARSGDVVVRLEDAVVERGDFTLGPFTLDIAWAERIALVGPNGSGKTTLVETLLGRLPLAAGTRRLGPSVVVGELAQDRRILGDVPNLADAFTAATGLPRDQARSQLAKFGLGRGGGGPSFVVAVAGRTHPSRAGRLRRAGRQFPRPRRADEPSRSPGHRAAGIGAAGVRRDPPARLPRPAPAPDGDHHPHRGAPRPPRRVQGLAHGLKVRAVRDRSGGLAGAPHRDRNHPAPWHHLLGSMLRCAAVALDNPASGACSTGGTSMTNNLEAAENMVRDLIASANRSHGTAAWDYELTSDVDNIEVVSGPGTHVLRIHPCWLRYVVAQGEFQCCVADEIEAWYMLEQLTAESR